MSELAQQIQNTAVPEFPALEVSPESPETLRPDDPSQEAMLSAEIAQLWQIHSDYKGSIKDQTQNLRALRVELGKRLSEMKQLLARPGRNGQWSAWLKERRISRATADRLVLQFEDSHNPDSNCLSESISEPTETEIQALLDKIAPKLRRGLRTPASAYKFIQLLAASFEGGERCVTEEAILIINPAQSAQTVVEQSAPEETEVEPLPVIANVLGKDHVQSSGTPMAL